MSESRPASRQASLVGDFIGNSSASERSKFKINIANSLGLSYKKQRAALLGVALGKPANYYELRANLVDQLTVKQVETFYDMYWKLLKEGIVNETQMKYKGADNGEYNLVPDLPEHLINKFASRVAATLEEIAEEAVSMIMPDDFLKLAHEKQKDILTAKGQI
jgi:hypothetical protein